MSSRQSPHIRVLLVDADPQATSSTWAEVATEKGHKPPTVVAMGKDMHRPGQLDQFAASFDVTIIDEARTVRPHLAARVAAPPPSAAALAAI